MIALFLAPIYICLNICIGKWLIKWLSACNKIFENDKIRKIIISIHILLASSILIGFILPISKIKRVFTIVGNYYLGVTLYVLLVVLIANLIRIILYKMKKIPKEKSKKKKIFVLSGIICSIIILGVTTLGVINARIIKTTEYDVVINKETKLEDLKIVMVADLHLGYNIGTLQMKKMVEKINEKKPDVVLIAGDIFDNDYDSLDDPEELIRIFKNINSKYGVYAVYGNHDIEEKNLAGFSFSFNNSKKSSDLRMDELLKKSNITLLKDDYISINEEIYIYGRADYLRPGRGIEERKKAEELVNDLEEDKVMIVMDHEPFELEELSKANIDLTLSGHTHNGQIFPGNILVNLLYENAYGYKKINNMHSIVTSGVGLFGPNMRVGTKSEVVVINVKFK